VNASNAAAAVIPGSQQKLIDAVNATAAEVPDRTLDDLILSRAAGQPSRPAVISARACLSYGEFSGSIIALSQALSEQGAGPGSRVVLCTDLGWEQVAGALAIMRAGATCVPVPPGLAQTARWDTARRTKSAAVVTQWWQIGRIGWPEEFPVLTVELQAAGTGPPPRQAADPDPPAALLPLGASGGAHTAISHRTAVNSIADVNGRIRLAPDDRVLAMAPPDSVLALYQTFGVALAGAAMVFGQDIDQHNPQAWFDQIQQDSVSVWIATPPLLTLALDYLASSGRSLPPVLRAVVLAGERLDTDQVRELHEAAGTGLLVGYATAPAPQHPWVAWHEADAAGHETRTVPIGRPMANQRLYVLNEGLAPCPVWVTGRLYFGGAAVWSHQAGEGPGPDTVTHPRTGEPLLASSLFGRLLPDGVVEVTGDESSQVIVHGRALRLQDVEVALAGQEAVRQAVVVPAADVAESVAHVRLRAGSAVTAGELADILRRKVSPYLLPAAIVTADELPLTTGGLVDRAALRARSPAHGHAVAPATPQPVLGAGDEELIRRVAAIACRQFDVPSIEPNVNLMDIGASSYQLVRLAMVLEEELGLAVDVEEVLRFPSVAVIVSSLGDAPPGTGPAVRAAPGPAEAAAPAAPTAPAAPAAPAAASPPRVVTDLTARQAFKDRHLGIRHDLDGKPGTALSGPADDRIAARRTTRSFDPMPVSLAEVSALLSATRMTMLDGEPKYWYPSAGGGYPVQIYVLAAPARVQDLPCGSYYYHPERNCLIPLHPDASLPASAHAEINRRPFRESAFALYLIGRMDAITPLYGDLSWDFAVFEAGAISQLLGQVAAEHGLGLCPIGTMDTAPLAGLFGLAANDRFLHALLGGRPAGGGQR
jgi:nonribosomal peptide synthetase protein BlmIII